MVAATSPATTVAPEDEHLLPVPTAVERVTGYRPTPSTAWRWTKRGVAGHKLETKCLGGRPVTSMRMVREFIRVTTAARA